VLDPKPPFVLDTVPDLARIAAADGAERARLLAGAAAEIRASVLRMIGQAGLGHVGGDLSAALYSTLALRGFIPMDLLGSFMAPLSVLNGHPNRRKVPGVEANTGPLGHGLPIGVGSAVAARLSDSPWRTFVVLGDGELQEGSNWEAAMSAGHRGLDNLTAIVDRNRLQQGARTEDTNRLEPLADKWRAFGWEVIELDGHDHAALWAAFTAVPTGKPRCVIARTIKGKGVSFMEDRVEWHHKVPSPAQIEQALAEVAR
jgi:transketolase